MTDITIPALLEAGVHFGHQTSFWNPKMAKYIYGNRNQIHIIDIQQTVPMMKEACAYAEKISADYISYCLLEQKELQEIAFLQMQQIVICLS